MAWETGRHGILSKLRKVSWERLNAHANRPDAAGEKNMRTTNDAEQREDARTTNNAASAPVQRVVRHGVEIAEFRSRLRDMASTFRFAAPWAMASTWRDLVAPFLSEADDSDDPEVQREIAKAEVAIKFIGTLDACLDWLYSFESA